MRRQREPKNSGLLVHWPVIVFGSALIALISTLAYQVSHSAPPSPGRVSGTVPVHYDRAGDAYALSRNAGACELQADGSARGNIKRRKKYRKCWHSSLAIATASGKDIAVSWTASRRITQQVAVSAFGRHSSPPKCIASRNRRRRFGRLSLKDRGSARGVQTNDCDRSSTTSTKPKRGNTNEDKTNSRKHHCGSHIFHDAHGGSDANASEHTWSEQAS